MSEKTQAQNHPDNEIPVIPQASIQQAPAPGRQTAARGDSRSTPVLYVESMSLEDLLERAELDLEAEFWPSAVTYADRALALDPENAKAWLYKLMADLKAADIDRLKLQKRPFGDHPFYRKVMQYGDAELRDRVSEADRYICDHLSDLYRDEMDRVRHDMEYASVASDLKGAEDLLERIPRFPAADGLREECGRRKAELFSHTFARAEEHARNGEWAEAVRLMESISYDENSRIRLIEYRKKLETENRYRQGVAFQEGNQFREAAETFAELGNYRDSAERLRKCNRMIRGNKVRAVGREHTKAAWVNVLVSAFMALGCTVSAPAGILVNLLWGIPLIAFSVVMTIIRARYRPAKRMWIVMAAVTGLFLVLSVTGLLPFGPDGSTLPSIIYLAMMLSAIFI